MKKIESKEHQLTQILSNITKWGDEKCGWHSSKCPQRTEPKEGDTEVTQKGQKKLLVRKPLEVKSLESAEYSKQLSDQKKQGQSYLWGGWGKKPRRGDSEQRETVHPTKEVENLWKSREACFEAIVFYSSNCSSVTELGIMALPGVIRKFCSGTLNQSFRAQLPFWEHFSPSFGDSWMNTPKVHCHLYDSLAVKPVKMTFFGVISLAKCKRCCCML